MMLQIKTVANFLSVIVFCVHQTHGHGDNIQIFYKCFKNLMQAVYININASLTQVGIFKASRALETKQIH